MPPWLAIVVVIVALGGLMVCVRSARRHFDWHPETSRKSVHVGMGLVCLSLPWLFREAWPVWLLAAGAAAVLGSLRVVPMLNARFGQVLGGVDRDSWGEILFPLSVAFVFWLAHGNTLLFCVPVLILSLADAVAALIGRRYGQARYETDDGWKTIEGSTAFFVAAFLSTHIPLLLFSTIGRLECLLIATVMGLILVLIEAIAWHGLDNVFIPVVSYVCLFQMKGMAPDGLGLRLVVLVAIILLLWSWRQSTRLTQSAVIGTALIIYVTWADADWRWLIAPVITAALYTALCRRPAGAPQKHTIFAIACVGGLGLVWLCISKITGTDHAIYAYGVGYSASLAMIALVHFADLLHSKTLFAAGSKAVAVSFLALSFPYLIVWRANPHAIHLAGGALILVVLSLTAFAAWQPMLRPCPLDARRWIQQGVLSGLASALAFALALLLDP